MKFIRNLLALIGLVTVVIVAMVGVKVAPMVDQLRQFDAQALDTYKELGQRLLAEGDAASATVWKVKVADGLSADDVATSMRYIANEHNIKNVGELPLYKQVAAMSGEAYRHAEIFMFCNALTAARMMDFNDAYSAYLPCRVSLVEDKEGNLWLYSLNMDLMIHGGKELPPELKANSNEFASGALCESR
ncbi:MAG: hypothetical protein AMJ69_04935 [Gammaproteobacteria bacterium SG8_47]|nr:MAG: hypothetical protein AMJ69_04935 [Gammaproteobacteria bacterium SG8_47]